MIASSYPFLESVFMYSQEISDAQIESISLLDSMGDPDFRLLISDLEAMDMSADPDLIAARLIDPDMNGKRPAQYVAELTYLVINLHVYSFRQEIETEDAVRAIVETYEILNEEFGKTNFKKIERRLNELTACYPLWFCAHAQLALDKRERVFSGCQFQTSMTPVEIDTDEERTDLESQSITGLISSLLTISYRQAGEEKSLSLFIDQYSIASLIANLEELKKEAETLQLVLSASDVEAVVV